MMRGARVFEVCLNTVAHHAPYYRQADAAGPCRSGLRRKQVKIVAGGPTQDGLAAFDYFIRHYDQGRRSFCRALAGIERAREPPRHVHESAPRCVQADGRGLHRRLLDNAVLPFPESLLKFARAPAIPGPSSLEHGSPTVAGTNPVLLPGGLAINPITWTRTQTRPPPSRIWAR